MGSTIGLILRGRVFSEELVVVYIVHKILITTVPDCSLLCTQQLANDPESAGVEYSL
jgi:hypothetical protein